MENKIKNRTSDSSRDPFLKLLRRVSHMTETRQFQLVKSIITHQKNNKEFMQPVHKIVRQSPALEIEVAGKDLLIQKINNWMEKRLQNFSPPHKMTPKRLAQECQNYYLKTWKKAEPVEKPIKEPTVKGLVTESQKRFRPPQRMLPLLWKIARQVKDRDRKRRKSEKNKSM